MSAALDLPAMTAADARERVDRVKAAVTQARGDLVALWRERAWLSLGYVSWDELCDVEFGVRMALPREERREVVADLRAEGMSTRAIGSALGVADQTVRADLDRVRDFTQTPMPERVTSLDGRERPATQPPREPAPTIQPSARPDPLSHPAVANNPDRLAAEYRRNLIAAVDRVLVVCQFDAERVADLIGDDHAFLIDESVRHLTEWAEKVRRHRSGLRVVRGARS